MEIFPKAIYYKMQSEVEFYAMVWTKIRRR
jgi:hypothetical protein